MERKAKLRLTEQKVPNPIRIGFGTYGTFYLASSAIFGTLA
jgi:hypothetical protein